MNQIHLKAGSHMRFPNKSHVPLWTGRRVTLSLFCSWFYSRSGLGWTQVDLTARNHVSNMTERSNAVQDSSHVILSTSKSKKLVWVWRSIGPSTFTFMVFWGEAARAHQLHWPDRISAVTVGVYICRHVCLNPPESDASSDSPCLSNSMSRPREAACWSAGWSLPEVNSPPILIHHHCPKLYQTAMKFSLCCIWYLSLAILRLSIRGRDESPQ